MLTNQLISLSNPVGPIISKKRNAKLKKNAQFETVHFIFKEYELKYPTLLWDEPWVPYRHLKP